MKIAFFCHSLLSDWNNGNAHFLRGLASELIALGHRVHCYEPRDAWSMRNMRAEPEEIELSELKEHYPNLLIEPYELETFDLDGALDVDLVVVHEWNEPQLVARIGAARARAGSRFRVLFHDTHHRSVSDATLMSKLGVEEFDGVLAFGEAIRQRYLAAGWAHQVWTFHEAADARVFRPLPQIRPEADLVWVGNYGDGERSAELHEYLLKPAAALGLSGSVYGVRYPESGRSAVQRAGLRYQGFLPNYRVPQVFARHRVTVHVPRRPYAEQLPGIPTIRVFEALACGIPLVSAPWTDSEGLFREGDFLRVENGQQMQSALRLLVEDEQAASAVAARGRETILSKHTCSQRAKQLLEIARELGAFTRSHETRPLDTTLRSETWG
jgi:spore maturation protein CgeB